MDTSIFIEEGAMRMSERQKEFDDVGYLVFENLFPKSEMERLRVAANEIVHNFDVSQHASVFSTTDGDRGRDAYFMESAEAVHCFLEEEALDDSGNLKVMKAQSINKIGHALHDQIPTFQQFCQRPIFAKILQEIGYQNPLLWQTMYIFKNPHIGGEVRWHQDASYLHTEPRSVTGIWVAIDDADRTNGCLWMCPHGHHSPLRERYALEADEQTGQLKTLDETPWPDAKTAVPLEVEAGSVVIFHDHMPHRSDANRSSISRHAFTMHVAEKSALWSPQNWLQRPNLADFHLGTV